MNRTLERNQVQMELVLTVMRNCAAAVTDRNTGFGHEHDILLHA